MTRYLPLLLLLAPSCVPQTSWLEDFYLELDPAFTEAEEAEIERAAEDWCEVSTFTCAAVYKNAEFPNVIRKEGFADDRNVGLHNRDPLLGNRIWIWADEARSVYTTMAHEMGHAFGPQDHVTEKGYLLSAETGLKTCIDTPSVQFVLGPDYQGTCD